MVVLSEQYSRYQSKGRIERSKIRNPNYVALLESVVLKNESNTNVIK
jgi:hypothetical protein